MRSWPAKTLCTLHGCPQRDRKQTQTERRLVGDKGAGIVDSAVRGHRTVQRVAVRRLVRGGQRRSQKDRNRPNSHIPPTVAHRLHETWLQAARHSPFWARLWCVSTHTQTCMAHTHGKDGHQQLRPPTNTDDQTNNPLQDVIPTHARAKTELFRWAVACTCVNVGVVEHMVVYVYYIIGAFSNMTEMYLDGQI